MKPLYIFLFVIGAAGQLSAQSGCPGCIISLPDSLPQDTIYIGAAPDADVQQAYDADVSFRLPMTTTPVANNGGNVPAGLNITEIEVLQVRNLPPGLSWEASQTIFATQEETDGCVKFCGTPLMADSFSMEVVLKASLGGIFSQETSVFIPLRVNPATVSNDGFTLVDNEACGSVTTTFINNVPSAGVDGFSYAWDFGDGSFSNAENPPAMTYVSPGIYPVTYQATIDTTGYFLSGVTVLETECGDAFGGLPDLKINIFNPAGDIIEITPIEDNAEVPIDYNFFIELEEGNYSIQVIDDDNGLGGADDDCGTIGFTRETGGEFSIGGLRISIDIFHPVTVVETSDTVYVYPQPETPLFAALTDPLICPEDSVELVVLNSIDAIQWAFDSSALAVPDSTTSIFVSTPGEYAVTFTTEDGCQSTAVAPAFDLLDGVDTVLLENFGNVVQVFDNFIPEGLDPFWELDGERIDETQLRFCATESGVYTLVLEDILTGCRSRTDIAVAVDPDLNCDVTSVFEPAVLVGAWSVFPNPGRGPLQLRGEGIKTNRVEVTLYSLAGVAQYVSYFEVSNQNWQTALELPELPTGMYYLQIASEQGVKTLPVLRQ